ncbi:MAG: 50S ribosomal protein L11 methyltransferase [Anaerolineales bacterium]|nr:50S ribosomal protein L11 methyltransferase [Anaerolineales bacterium]
MANILGPILIRLFDAGLADLIEPNGEIILSGILDHQAGVGHWGWAGQRVEKEAKSAKW